MLCKKLKCDIVYYGYEGKDYQPYLTTILPGSGRDSNSGPFNTKFNALTSRPRIQTLITETIPTNLLIIWLSLEN